MESMVGKHGRTRGVTLLRAGAGGEGILSQEPVENLGMESQDDRVAGPHVLPLDEEFNICVADEFVGVAFEVTVGLERLHTSRI